MKSRADGLVFLAVALMAICLSGPAIDLTDQLIVRHPVRLPAFFEAPFAILWFLDYACGKVFAGVLSLCVLAALFSREIRWWTKMILVIVTVEVWRVLPPFIERSKHLW
jgi:hypothetical protein